MKTIYLKANTQEELIEDIANVVSIPKAEGNVPYNGDIEFSNGIIHGHYIGKIVDTYNKETNEFTYLDGYHANLLVPDDFDDSVFKTKINNPQNPKHKFFII